jgi:hypothetical protein
MTREHPFDQRLQLRDGGPEDSIQEAEAVDRSKLDVIPVVTFLWRA